MKYDIDSLLSKASSTTTFRPSRYTGGAGKYSFGIINSHSNGKRITLSKALGQALMLDDTAEFILIPEDGVLMVSKAFPSGLAEPQKLNGDPRERRICYNADLVKGLTDTFKIDFSEHVSRSFFEITIEDHGGTAVAVIDMSKPAQANHNGKSV